MGAGATGKSTDNAGFSEEINLEEVKSMSKFELYHLNFVSHSLSLSTSNSESQDVDRTLHLKGQMIYISQWNAILFLACPVMKDLNNLIWSGLFVNDLRLV